MKANPLVKIFYTWYRQAIRHTKYRWLVILATFFYWVMPVDLAPDWIPFIGWLDDGILATMLVTEVSELLMSYRGRRKTDEVETEEVLETKSV
ncbi:YkvA family protein [Chroococcus sp. FPU101]|uniref:YkvA family protein n=1 Tax=Chroococcus sp. FPU101 TaxID=1974212 RepID=UPI001A8D9492|nr:DUF1232 domain-containing protein [Chroococcus sp. FPU101]GFE70687.1 hypothetical protein CFPU101_32970 [Chroococcus sp. FPU101]